MRREPKDSISEDYIDVSLKYLCREGQAQRQKFEQIRRELPPQELVLELESASLHPDTGLSPHDFTTLATLVEFGRVSDVLDYNSLPDVSVYESLIHLKKQNLIRVAPSSSK